MPVTGYKRKRSARPTTATRKRRYVRRPGSVSTRRVASIARRVVNTRTATQGEGWG